MLRFSTAAAAKHGVVATSVQSPKTAPRTVALVGGTGFVGRHVTKHLIEKTPHQVWLIARHPSRAPSWFTDFVATHAHRFLPSLQHDIASAEPLNLRDADTVINFVGIMYGDHEAVQLRGARKVREASGEKPLIHLSAIGADELSDIPYARTKGLAERQVLESKGDARAVVLRPSIVYGDDDSFFNRFEKLSQYLPVMPVFGQGTSRFQPVHVDDLSKCILSILRQHDFEHWGSIIEVGGKRVMTYREIIEYVLQRSNRFRPIIPVPWSVGYLQGLLMEQLPETLFTISRDQIRLLQKDNIVGHERVEHGIHIIPASKVWDTMEWQEPRLKGTSTKGP